MTTPRRRLVLDENPLHAPLSRVWGEAYAINARPFLSISKEEILMLDQGVEILLVEDNANDEMLALLAFKRQKIANDVHVVRDGAEALEYIFCTGAYANRRFENPKVILLDLKLPLVDGIEVLRHVRSDPRTRLIPIVVLTSSSEERDMLEAYNLRVNSYIVKPVDFDQFNEVAKHVVYYWLLLNRQPLSLIGSTSDIVTEQVSF
jgi:two-component system, response regulator